MGAAGPVQGTGRPMTALTGGVCISMSWAGPEGEYTEPRAGGGVVRAAPARPEPSEPPAPPDTLLTSMVAARTIATTAAAAAAGMTALADQARRGRAPPGRRRPPRLAV